MSLDENYVCGILRQPRSQAMPMTPDIKAQILSLRGKKSAGLIAQELGLSRNAVAGLFFRKGHKVNGKHAEERLRQSHGRSPGRSRGEFFSPGLRLSLLVIIEKCGQENNSDTLRQEVLDPPLR